MRRCLAALLMVLAMPALAAEVSGSAYYRERIAAPPGARFEAVLLDVARADAPATELGRFVKEDAGNPPYAFAIAVDPAALSPQGRYAVRATLTLADGRLFFTSDTMNAVRPGEDAGPLEIRMVKVGAVAAAEPVALVGPRWALAEIAGSPAPADTKAHLGFDAEGRLGGDGGCNRLGADYLARDDGAFLAGRAFSTMMACPEPAMTTERAVHDALDRARGWRIEGDRLTLTDANGVALAVFVAGPAE